MAFSPTPTFVRISFERRRIFVPKPISHVVQSGTRGKVNCQRIQRAGGFQEDVKREEKCC